MSDAPHAITLQSNTFLTTEWQASCSCGWWVGCWQSSPDAAEAEHGEHVRLAGDSDA